MTQVVPLFGDWKNSTCKNLLYNSSKPFYMENEASKVLMHKQRLQNIRYLTNDSL